MNRDYEMYASILPTGGENIRTSGSQNPKDYCTTSTRWLRTRGSEIGRRCGSVESGESWPIIRTASGGESQDEVESLTLLKHKRENSDP